MYVNEIINSFDSLEALLIDFSYLFTTKLEEIKGMKAELHLDKDDTAIFCKTRTVTYTYALRAAVNEELQTLQDEGIIERSKWSNPLVPVVRPNGKIVVILN